MRSASWSHTWRLASSKILIHTLGREKTLDAMRVLWQTRLHLKLTLIVFIRCYVQSKHGQWMNSWRMSYLFIRLLVFNLLSSLNAEPTINQFTRHACPSHPSSHSAGAAAGQAHGTVLHADSGAHWVSEQAGTWASSCDSQELHVPGSSSSKAGSRMCLVRLPVPPGHMHGWCFSQPLGLVDSCSRLVVLARGWKQAVACMLRKP